MSPKVRVRPDGASRAVAYAKVILAERLENPFDEAGNCYILYRPDSIPMKSVPLMLPTSDNIFYTTSFLMLCIDKSPKIIYTQKRQIL